MDREFVDTTTTTTPSPSPHSSSTSGAVSAPSSGTADSGSVPLSGLSLLPPEEMSSQEYRALLSPNSTTTTDSEGGSRAGGGGTGTARGGGSGGGNSNDDNGVSAPLRQSQQPELQSRSQQQQHPQQQPQLPPNSIAAAQSMPTPTRSFDDSVMGSSVASSISSNTYTHLAYPVAGGGGFPTMSGQTIETQQNPTEVDHQQQLQHQMHHHHHVQMQHSAYSREQLQQHQQLQQYSQLQQQQHLQQHQQQHHQQQHPHGHHHPDATRALFRGYNTASPSSQDSGGSGLARPGTVSAGAVPGGAYAGGYGGGSWTPGSAASSSSAAAGGGGAPHVPLSELDTVYEIDGVVSRDDSTTATGASGVSGSGGESLATPSSSSSMRSPKAAAAAAAAQHPLLPSGEGGGSAVAVSELDTSVETVATSNIVTAGGGSGVRGGGGASSSGAAAAAAAGGRDDHGGSERRSPERDDDSAIALLHSFGATPIRVVGGSNPVNVDELAMARPAGSDGGAGGGVDDGGGGSGSDDGARSSSTASSSSSWQQQPQSLVRPTGSTATSRPEDDGTSGGDAVVSGGGGGGRTRSGGGGSAPPVSPDPSDLLLGRFLVDAGDPLHYSDDEAFLRATEFVAQPSRKGRAPPRRRVVLKLTNDAEGTSAELKHRKGIDPRSVLPVLGTYVDRVAEAAAVAGGEGTVMRYDGPIAVTEADGMAEEIAECIKSRLCDNLAAVRRRANGSSGGADAAKGRKKGNDDPSFRYVLVLEHYDCTLQDVMRHGIVDLSLARKVVKDVVLGLILLHTETIMHGDVNPRGMVRVGGAEPGTAAKWKLCQLQSSRRFGEERRKAKTVGGGGGGGGFGDDSAKRCNWAHSPPEAVVAMYDESTSAAAAAAAAAAGAARAETQSIAILPSTSSEPLTPRSRSAADAAHDLWSLGCVLYRLVLGRPLWNADRDGNLTDADLSLLAKWSPRSLARRVTDWINQREGDGRDGGSEGGGGGGGGSGSGGGGGGNEDVRPALDLTGKLLAPTPEDRRANFEFGIVSVHQHEFLAGRHLDRTSLGLYQSRLNVLQRDDEEHGSYLRVTSELGLDERWELRRVRDVLLLGAFEPTEKRIPTSFVILKERLRRPRPSARNRDAGDLVRDRLDEGLMWAERFEELEPSVRGALHGDISSIGHFWGKIAGMFQGDYMFLYFIDELTGEPVFGSEEDEREGIYPIEITTWSDVVPKLLPLMHLTMRAMALYHGVAGIARMFGGPKLAGEFPDDLRAVVQARVDSLKTERGETVPFGPIADDIARLDAFREQFLKGDDSVRCKSLRELVRFLEKKAGRGSDDTIRFAGLNRYPDESGRAIWTTLVEALDVKSALQKRTEERLKEAVCQWVGGRQDELDTLQRDFFQERERGAQLELQIDRVKAELRESTGLIGSLENKIVEVELSLDQTRQELARANQCLEDERSVVSKSGGGMFKLKTYRKKKDVMGPGKENVCEIVHVKEVLDPL